MAVKSKIMEDEQKVYTWADLKKEVNELSESELAHPVKLQREEGTLKIAGMDVTSEPIYFHVENEDCGPLKEMKDIYGDEFNEEEFYVTPKGFPYLVEDFG